MRLPETMLLTPALLLRFEAEGIIHGGDGRYCGAIERDNGDLSVFHPFSPGPMADQLLWAQVTLRALNRELHHDGAWAVVFTHPRPVAIDCAIKDIRHVDYRRYCLLWVDKDGDVQFTSEWEEGDSEMLNFAEVLEAGLESALGRCEMAWEQWKFMMRDVLDPQEGQLIKRAQGQMPSTARH